jgi:GT2 family glycosyltransferase
MIATPVDLIPEYGVEEVDGERFACARQPWLSLRSDYIFASGNWIRLRYRSSFFDDPVRPLIRFKSPDGNVSIQVLNGPVLGAGESIVRVPDNTVSVSISPMVRPGRFDFAIDGIERVSRARLLAQGVLNGPKWAMVSLGARLINARQESQQALKFAATSTGFNSYHTWYRALSRPLDLNGLDRPRSDWRTGPVIRFVMALEGHDANGLDATLKSFRSQVYSRWSVHVLVGPRTGQHLLAAYRRQTYEDPRFAEIDPRAATIDPRAAVGDRVAVIGVGDTLPNYALAVVAETIAREPDAAVVYGDEDAAAPDGSLHDPMFKPNWSPTFQAASAYIGRLTCLRYEDLVSSGWGSPEQLLFSEPEALNGAIHAANSENIIHVRRILYRRVRECKAPQTCQRSVGIGMPKINPGTRSWPELAVILPTRDHANYLRKCINGLRETTDYPCLSVVVVDNGSTAPDAIALLDEVAKDRQFTVLRFPGPFNYSAMCNHGALNTRAAFLVLLNNDIAMIESDWLKPLVALAIRADVGAVGAKLLYPSGRIQHAGIVIGSGGRAGHLYKGAAVNEVGYLDQLRVAREVAAVTGACMAIERWKYEAVGGLDATNLPVDLNDVDLCLRLCERGWKTIWTPDSVLCHLESGSRRQALNPSNVYERERHYFIQRWGHIIRDDPYFHPALSLFSHRPALASG